MTTLADRLKDIRKANNLTQSELGKILGVGKTTISMYETGNSTPNDDIKLKISEYFNISIDYLLGLSDSKDIEYNKKIEKATSLKDALIDFMIERGLIKDRNNINEEHLKLIELSINTYIENKKDEV